MLDDKIKPEYVLVVEKTSHWGPLVIVLSGNGRQLDLVRIINEDDKAFYQLMGVKPEYAPIDASQTKTMRADLQMPLWVHGKQRELADVVDSLYNQNQGIEKPQEAAVPEKSFLSRHKPLLVVVTYATGTLPFASASALINYFKIPILPYLIAAFSITALGIAGGIYGMVKVRKEDDRRRKIERENMEKKLKHTRDVDALFLEADIVRESLLQAGVIRGIFPERYGLR